MLDKSEWEHELITSLSNMVAVVQDGVIEYINPAGSIMLGEAQVEDVIGQKLATFIHEDYAELIDMGLDAFIEEEDGTPLKIITKTGPALDVSLRVSLLTSPADAPVFMVECRDISQYIRAAQEARSREQRLASVFAAVADAIITIDAKGIIQTLNLATSKIFGYATYEMQGQKINMLMPEEYRDAHDGYLENYVKTRVSSVIGSTREMIGQRKSGEAFPIEVSLTEMREGSGHFYTGIIRDITDRKKAQDIIHHLAHHDSLTGLPNRNLFGDRMTRAISRAGRSETPFALMFVDLDNFKPVNDTLGHEAGDLVLKAVADHITDCLRGSDTVARIGGDEFVAILESLEHPEDAAIVAQKILDALSQPIDVSTADNPNTTVQVGASIGISIYPQDGKTLDTLSHAADTAMYQVKGAGRNHFLFYAQTQSDEGAS